MSYEIKYTAAQKKKLKTFEWKGRGSATGAMRAMKMVVPRCEQCQTPENVGEGSPYIWTWMKECNHGPEGMGPYWNFSPKTTKVQKVVQDEDPESETFGEFMVEDVIVRTRMILSPNVVEIPISPRFEDGEAVQKDARHGFRVLPDIGLNPMCEMYGCGKGWPTFGTDFGAYCSQMHAKLCAADADEINLVIWSDEGKKKSLLSAQLRSIDV